MSLTIIRLKSGKFQFRSSNRVMPIDEVVRRVPVEWVETIDKDAARYLEDEKRKAVAA